MSRLIEIDRPSDEREVIWSLRHGCTQGIALRKVLGPDVDELLFLVGHVGEGMPTGIPFAVPCVDPCEACGAYVQAWFQWRKTIVSI